MRFRNGLRLVLAMLVVSCTTTPPTPTSKAPPSVVETVLSSYQSAADGPRVLEQLDRALDAGELTAADLSTPDLTVYSNLLLTGERWAEAEQAFQVLAEREPSNAEAAWALVLLAGARGDEATQKARLDAFEAAHPGDREALLLRAQRQRAAGDRAGAQATWTQVLAGGENLEALVGLAQLALEAKKPKDAQPYAERAVKAFPHEDQAWATRALVREALGQDRDAFQDWNRAVELAPDDAWHRLDRASVAFLKLFDARGAAGDLEFATVRLPQNFLAWELYAEVNEALDRPRAAYDAWRKTLSLRPDYRYAYPSAAMLSFRYQDFAAAAQYARLAAKDYPAEYAFPIVEALSLRAQGDLAGAKTVLEKARPRFTRGSTVDELFRFLLTPSMDYAFNAAMNLEKDEKVRVRLRFYQGCYYALTKSPASAKAAFDEVSTSTLHNIPEIPAARDWMDHGL